MRMNAVLSNPKHPEYGQFTLESFSDKYPHQVAAVKAEVAYFNLDYEKALALDLTILPWLEEWYYSNVSDEHMIAMTVAAIQLHREQELIEALMKEQARIRAENGLPSGIGSVAS